MEDGNEDWVAESVESALKRRRLHVLHLLSLGWNKSQIARATGEHRRTVCRWAKKVVTPPTPVKPLNHRPCADSQAKVVTPYEKNTPQERFFCFDSEGNPDIAIYDDPIDHIEPLRPLDPDDIADSKRNLILSAALRYLMLMEHRSMESVAKDIGCTRAAISRTLGLLSDQLGFKALNQKSDCARARYREVQLQRAQSPS